MTTNMWVEQVTNLFQRQNPALFADVTPRFFSTLICLPLLRIDVAVQRRNGWTTNWNGTPMTTAASRRCTFRRKIYGCPTSSSTTSMSLYYYTPSLYCFKKKNLKVYCIETKPMSNEYWPCFSIDAPVLTETTKWLLWPRQFYAMTERWRGSRRPSTNPSAKSMSSTSRSTSKPATWNSVHGLRMAIR